MHSLKSRESRSPFAGRLSRIAAETDLILTNPPACQPGLSPTFVDDQCCYSSDVGAYVLRGWRFTLCLVPVLAILFA